MPWIVRLDSFNDQSLRRKICLGDKIDVALGADLHNPAEFIGEYAAGIAGRLNSEVEQLILFGLFGRL